MVVDMPLTGICTIDTKKAVKLWHKGWFLSQYDQKYTLCIRRKGSEKPWFKAEISVDQAEELKTLLNLQETRSDVFRKASSWRRPGEFDGM